MEAVCLKSRLQSWLLLIVRHKRSLFCLVGVFVVENWPESFVIIGTIWIVERAASVTGPAGVLFQMFFFTQLLSRK